MRKEIRKTRERWGVRDRREQEKHLDVLPVAAPRATTGNVSICVSSLRMCRTPRTRLMKIVPIAIMDNA